MFASFQAVTTPQFWGWTKPRRHSLRETDGKCLLPSTRWVQSAVWRASGIAFSRYCPLPWSSSLDRCLVFWKIVRIEQIFIFYFKEETCHEPNITFLMGGCWDGHLKTNMRPEIFLPERLQLFVRTWGSQTLPVVTAAVSYPRFLVGWLDERWQAHTLLN